MTYRCPFCGCFSSYTRLDSDIWQCDNCQCFLSSADFERRASGKAHSLTISETIQIVLVMMFVCLFVFALIMVGALP